MKNILARIFILFVVLSSYSYSSFAQEENSAVVIMYHRFGEEKFPSTNVTLEQFEAHIAELNKEKYNVVPLKDIAEAFKNKTPLPPRTIAITIDDGYLSIYEEAWPRLIAANLPFTVFISTEPVKPENSGSMSWDQIREISQNPLVDIGHHGHGHAHMSQIPIQEAKEDIETANQIFQSELGYIPELFAYPYGEYSEALIGLLNENNHTSAFAQYSSAIGLNNDIMALPRFAFNQNYSDIERFKLIINSRTLPVKDILPRTAELENNPPMIGFTVDGTINGLNNLQCFPSHMNEPAELKRLGENRIEVRFQTPFPTGRQRVNCTMPGPDGRWYWLGMPFFNF